MWVGGGIDGWTDGWWTKGWLDRSVDGRVDGRWMDWKMDEFNKQPLSTYSVPSTVLGPEDTGMEGSCSQPQRTSESPGVKCHGTDSAHGERYGKGEAAMVSIQREFGPSKS